MKIDFDDEVSAEEFAWLCYKDEKKQEWISGMYK